MRLGTSSPLKHENAKDWAAQMKKLGLGSVVFPLDYKSDEKLINEYVEAARENDLVIAEVGAWCNPISIDKNVRDAAMERCIEQLKLADRIGAKCCVNVCGSAGDIWDGPYKENFSYEWFSRTVESIQKIIDEANPKNTFYAIEPMPWMFPRNPDEYLKLIKAVNRERFAVHMDIVNWITSPEKYFFNEDLWTSVFQNSGIISKAVI